MMLRPPKSSRLKLRQSQYAAWLLALPVLMLVYIAFAWQWHPSPARLPNSAVNAVNNKADVFLFVGILSGVLVWVSVVARYAPPDSAGVP